MANELRGTIAVFVVGLLCLITAPVAAQQRSVQPGPEPGTQVDMPGFNVQVEPIRVNILKSYGYYQVTPNGNIVLYLVTGVPSATAMQGLLAMFGRGNQYDTRGFYEVTTNGELVLYPPTSQSGAETTGGLEMQGMILMPGIIVMPGSPGLRAMPSMSAMWGFYGMPGLGSMLAPGMQGMPGMYGMYGMPGMYGMYGMPGMWGGWRPPAPAPQLPQ
jgi:hypothetical protein